MVQVNNSPPHNAPVPPRLSSAHFGLIPTKEMQNGREKAQKTQNRNLLFASFAPFRAIAFPNGWLYIKLTHAMKKSVPYEIIAAASGMCGAVLLVAVYYPVINPVQFRIDNHQASAPLSSYIFGTIPSLLVLSGAWYFNRKAQSLKQQAETAKHEKNPYKEKSCSTRGEGWFIL